jgi:ATPase subunit of ABC transporter with duplicated ATPase domains
MKLLSELKNDLRIHQRNVRKCADIESHIEKLHTRLENSISTREQNESALGSLEQTPNCFDEKSKVLDFGISLFTEQFCFLLDEEKHAQSRLFFASLEKKVQNLEASVEKLGSILKMLFAIKRKLINNRNDCFQSFLLQFNILLDAVTEKLFEQDGEDDDINIGDAGLLSKNRSMIRSRFSLRLSKQGKNSTLGTIKKQKTTTLEPRSSRDDNRNSSSTCVGDDQDNEEEDDLSLEKIHLVILRKSWKTSHELPQPERRDDVKDDSMNKKKRGNPNESFFSKRKCAFAELSNGERTRLEMALIIVLTIVCQNKFLIFDEFFSSLDRKTAARCMSILTSFLKMDNNPSSFVNFVLVISHDIDDDIFDRVLNCPFVE